MEMSSQLHAPATLPPGKELLVPCGKEGGWTPRASMDVDIRHKNIFVSLVAEITEICYS